VEEYNIKFVANYIRKSRAENEQDLEKQRIILIDLCNKNKFKYVEYVEVGSSDSIDMRPQISKLLKEVEVGLYDAVCITEYDRLGRGDLGEQDRIKKAFQKSNTLIITPEKIYDLNDDMDETFTDYKSFFARQEYKMITKRLRQGKQIGAKRGQWTNGTPPFPYVYQRYANKYNEKGLVVNDERLLIYREIVDQALNGITPKKIAENLNQRGLFTAKGNLWSRTTIDRLLMDETHLGKIISNKTQGDGHKNKHSNAKEHKSIPKSEWVVVENCHESVKTPEEHNKILEIMSQRRSIPVKSRKQTHALTGLVKCSKCGSPHVVHTVDGKVYIKPCQYTDGLGNNCKNKGILSDALEKMLLEEIINHKQEFIKYASLINMKTDEVIAKALHENKALLLKYQQNLDSICDAYEMGNCNREEWKNQKESLEESIKQVEIEIYKLKGMQNQTHEERSNDLLNFFNNIMTLLDNNQRNGLYKSIADSIIYSRDGNTIDVKIIFK